VPLCRCTTMARKQNRKSAKPEPTPGEKQIEALKTAIAQAMILRNTLPKSASDEEKAAAAVRVQQLQAQHHEAVQHVLATRREETAQLERERKEKKLRHKRLAASRQPSGHAAPEEEHAALPRSASVRPTMNREAEDAQMDAINEEDLLLERRQLEEAENRESAEELAHQRALAQKKRKKELAAASREARKREKLEAQMKVEAARLKAEKETRAKIRQHAALQRAEAAQANKRQQRADREAQQRAAQDARSSAWFSELLRKLTAFFRRSP